MKRLWEIDGAKPSTAEFPVTLDLTKWLSSETISTVTYSATKVSDGTSATSDVLDENKHTNTTALVKPWIKGGTSGESYLVKMDVTSSANAKDSFYIKFTVFNY